MLDSSSVEFGSADFGSLFLRNGFILGESGW